MSSDRVRRAVGRLLSGHPRSRASGTDTGSAERVSVDRLAAEVAAHVDGSTDDVVLRESIGLFLRQRLSRLDDTSGVELDESNDTVLMRGADVRLRGNASPMTGLNWRRYYSIVSISSIQLLLLDRFGGPLSTLLDATSVLLLTFVFLLVGCVCHQFLGRSRALT